MIFTIFFKISDFLFGSAGAWERSRRIGTVRFRRLLVMLFHHLLVAESFEFDTFSSFSFLFFSKARARALPKTRSPVAMATAPSMRSADPSLSRDPLSPQKLIKKMFFSFQILSILDYFKLELKCLMNN